MKYSAKEVSEAYRLSLSTIRQRAVRLGIRASLIKSNRVYEFTDGEIYDIVNFNQKPIKLPEIVYIHTIWEVRESKINFM